MKQTLYKKAGRQVSDRYETEATHSFAQILGDAAANEHFLYERSHARRQVEAIPLWSGDKRFQRRQLCGPKRFDASQMESGNLLIHDQIL